MSWQCPKCETVNQDVTPVCTVCDNIAPVVESYLSLEAIEHAAEYNEKLDAIHLFEATGNYEAMLDTAMEAIALYKQNSLALDKARHALLHLTDTQLKAECAALLDKAMKGDFREAALLLDLMDALSIDTSEFSVIRSEVRSKLSAESKIEEILSNSYKAIIKLDTAGAMKIVEEGLSLYPSSESLQLRRDDIKNLIRALSAVSEPGKKRKPFPVPSSKVTSSSICRTPATETTITDLKPTKRKFPKIERK